MTSRARLRKLRSLTFMESRIPALDAIITFVPNSGQTPDHLQKLIDKGCSMRWYPTKGGHEVLVLHESGKYDEKHFKLEKGAWDHEHCDECGESIEPMTLCWVTKSGEYILLCSDCHSKL